MVGRGKVRNLSTKDRRCRKKGRERLKIVAPEPWPRAENDARAEGGPSALAEVAVAELSVGQGRPPGRFRSCGPCPGSCRGWHRGRSRRCPCHRPHRHWS